MPNQGAAHPYPSNRLLLHCNHWCIQYLAAGFMHGIEIQPAPDELRRRSSASSCRNTCSAVAKSFTWISTCRVCSSNHMQHICRPIRQLTSCRATECRRDSLQVHTPLILNRPNTTVTCGDPAGQQRSGQVSCYCPAIHVFKSRLTLLALLSAASSFSSASRAALRASLICRAAQHTPIRCWSVGTQLLSTTCVPSHVLPQYHNPQLLMPTLPSSAPDHVLKSAHYISLTRCAMLSSVG